MNTNILALASGLSDQDLLARVGVLAGREREASVELVAHLAVLDALPVLFAAAGHGSLFTYCTEVLRLSEDATCNRIQAARACRDFPMILDLLASGAMSLTSVRILRPHLTPENHEAVLARASGRSRREIEALVAELAPRPDVPSSVRKLPTATPAPPVMRAATSPATRVEAATLTPPEPAPRVSSPPPLRTIPRPIIETTSPERYRVQFTIGKESHDKLRRVQALLRREIPDGDPGAIFDRALTLLLEKVENAKLGAATKPRPRSIRPGADRELRTPVVPSRDIPRHVQRGVSQRDGGQCAFVSRHGHRCTERTFLEFHHILPYAQGGLATIENISLRCRRHNQYEAELVFGPHGTSEVREAQGFWPAGEGYLPAIATSSTSKRNGVFGGMGSFPEGP
ncbi:MAG TPA: HNH endonuclease [Vicinamibacteria bacterium]